MQPWYKLAICGALCACLAGCGFKDGVYTARLADFDSLGYQDYLTVTVADGVITSAEFDALSPEGGKKSEDQTYAQLMRPITGTTPAQITDHYQALLNGAKSYSKVQVDAISGATVSSRSFARLWAALKKPLQKGEPQPVTLENAPELPASSSGE